MLQIINVIVALLFELQSMQTKEIRTFNIDFDVTHTFNNIFMDLMLLFY